MAPKLFLPFAFICEIYNRQSGCNLHPPSIQAETEAGQRLTLQPLCLFHRSSRPNASSAPSIQTPGHDEVSAHVTLAQNWGLLRQRRHQHEPGSDVEAGGSRMSAEVGWTQRQEGRRDVNIGLSHCEAPHLLGGSCFLQGTWKPQQTLAVCRKTSDSKRSSGLI